MEEYVFIMDILLLYIIYRVGQNQCNIFSAPISQHR